jgi:GNAT superfamily N-acetyltransferase
MHVAYKINTAVSADQFIKLLEDSTLAERRPTEDRACMKGMLANSNLLVSAWDGAELVGIARSVTDFHYACYLSDLAVARSHQERGIGKRLQAVTQEQLGPRCKLILLAAPAADSYYKHLGYSHNPRAWVLDRSTEINS